MSTDIALPRPSSTVVLIRPADTAPQVFMVKRHQRSSFGDAYAFPGGVLEDSDRCVYAHCSGVPMADANRLLDVGAGGLDYYSAAVRELFEEAGVLLGTTAASMSDLITAREALNDGSLQWDRFVAEADLVLQLDRLHYFSFWITPEQLPKRYSTRFFLAMLPEGQVANHCGGELTDSKWMAANDVLQASKAGSIKVHYPTRKILEQIARPESLSKLFAWADDCADAGVACVQPVAVPREEA